MMYFLLAVFVILLLLYLMPVAINIYISRDNENDKIIVGLKTLYGLINFKSEIPFLIITFENGKPVVKYKVEVANRKRNRLLAMFTKLFSIEDGERLYRGYKNNKDWIIPSLRYITRKTKIINPNLRLCIGTGDAAVTGILYGTAWIVIGNVMTFVRSHFILNEPRITVIPVFNKPQMDIDFSCIIRMKSGDIINTGIRAIPGLISDIRK